MDFADYSPLPLGTTEDFGTALYTAFQVLVSGGRDPDVTRLGERLVYAAMIAAGVTVAAILVGFITEASRDDVALTDWLPSPLAVTAAIHPRRLPHRGRHRVHELAARGPHEGRKVGPHARRIRRWWLLVVVQRRYLRTTPSR
jgi:hypothetical protein